jgi:7,8-dihydropterin-6-yl-methyl-4-(beta-D-ribofuranosyl)aminobenzene 5'-phosphate synthase
MLPNRDIHCSPGTRSAPLRHANLELLGVRSESIDATVLSCGHYDHSGGLAGLLATNRVRRGTPFLFGGGQAFCHRLRGTRSDASSFDTIARLALKKTGIALIVSDDPHVIAGHGFTKGKVPFVASEHPRVPTAMLSERNWSGALLEPARRDVDLVVDDAVHELGIAFDVAGRGLVVIGPRSHRGIINTVRQTQAVSGATRVHAIVGGFHLVPPGDQGSGTGDGDDDAGAQTGLCHSSHCSGALFFTASSAVMPDKVVRAVLGAGYRFGHRG